MNSKYLLIGLFMLFSTATFAQEKTQWLKVVYQCETILELNEKITQLKDSIGKSEKEIVRLRREWEKTCNEFLKSPEAKTREDFAYLINNTDSITEKELYNRLVEASKYVDDDNRAPQTSADGKDSPEIPPAPAPVKQNNDAEKKEEKKSEKKKDKQGQKGKGKDKNPNEQGKKEEKGNDKKTEEKRSEDEIEVIKKEREP